MTLLLLLNPDTTPSVPQELLDRWIVSSSARSRSVSAIGVNRVSISLPRNTGVNANRRGETLRANTRSRLNSVVFVPNKVGVDP